MIYVVELKRYKAGTGIFGIIISKLCYRNKLYLIILFKVNKNSKLSFYYIVLPLNLAICLRIKSN